MNSPEVYLTTAIRAALAAQGVQDARVILEKPRDATHGDIATNAALMNAKGLGKSPKIIADELVSQLKLDSGLIRSLSVAGPGFINFTLAPAYLQSVVSHILAHPESYGETDDSRGTKVQIEFVSANPSGPLNVVSARAAAVGDSLLRLFRARGAVADGEFYVNDGGNQVRLLGESLWARCEELQGRVAEIPEGGYHGEYILDLAREIMAESGTKSGGLSRDDSAQHLGRRAVEYFRSAHERILERFGVHYSNWFRENLLRDSGLDIATLNELKSRGVTYEKDGATYLKTSEFGDPQDWVVLTSDGRPTYFLPDIAYHASKIERGYDVIIDILGPDHHAYLTKMKAGLNALGKAGEKLEVHLLQHVTLLRDGEPVKMSKRAGRLIEMEELLDEVGVDSARYFFILRRTSTPLEFDIELAKKQSDENPVYYVQYAHARIESIFKKGGVAYPPAHTDVSALVQPEELDLIRRLREMSLVIRECTNGRDPHGMTTWLREVAAEFHRFYHNCRVLGDVAAVQDARLALCRATQIALARGLSLCGVSAPKEM
jgi:arginyl-tRNA synthetase